MVAWTLSATPGSNERDNCSFSGPKGYAAAPKKLMRHRGLIDRIGMLAERRLDVALLDLAVGPAETAIWISADQLRRANGVAVAAHGCAPSRRRGCQDSVVAGAHDCTLCPPLASDRLAIPVPVPSPSVGKFARMVSATKFGARCA